MVCLSIALNSSPPCVFSFVSRSNGKLRVKLYARRHAALVQSNTPVAKAELISDMKSLFDAIPLLKLFLWLRSRFHAPRLNRREKSTAKEP